MVTPNSNNTAHSIGTIAGCSDQRERNITTGLFGLGYSPYFISAQSNRSESSCWIKKRNPI